MVKQGSDRQSVRLPDLGEGDNAISAALKGNQMNLADRVLPFLFNGLTGYIECHSHVFGRFKPMHVAYI